MRLKIRLENMSPRAMVEFYTMLYNAGYDCGMLQKELEDIDSTPARGKQRGPLFPSILLSKHPFGRGWCAPIHVRTVKFGASFPSSF